MRGQLVTLLVSAAAVAIWDRELTASIVAVTSAIEDIFPDVLSQALAEGWRGGVAKQFERQNAALLPLAEPVAS